MHGCVFVEGRNLWTPSHQFLGSISTQTSSTFTITEASNLPPLHTSPLCTLLMMIMTLMTIISPQSVSTCSERTEKISPPNRRPLGTRKRGGVYREENVTAVSLQSPFPVPERNLLLTSANAHSHRERHAGTKENTLSFPSMFLKTGGGQDYPSQHILGQFKHYSPWRGNRYMHLKISRC